MAEQEPSETSHDTARSSDTQRQRRGPQTTRSKHPSGSNVSFSHDTEVGDDDIVQVGLHLNIATRAGSGYSAAVWFMCLCVSISSHAVWVMICVKEKILCATIIWRCWACPRISRTLSASSLMIPGGRITCPLWSLLAWTSYWTCAMPPSPSSSADFQTTCQTWRCRNATGPFYPFMFPGASVNYLALLVNERSMLINIYFQYL